MTDPDEQFTKITPEVDALMDEIIRVADISLVHKAQVMSGLCSFISAMIGASAKNESAVLDGIKIMTDHIRKDAAETFVQIQAKRKAFP